jgi:hypothetical protein
MSDNKNYQTYLEYHKKREASNQSQLSVSASITDFLALEVKDTQEGTKDLSTLSSLFGQEAY